MADMLTRERLEQLLRYTDDPEFIIDAHELRAAIALALVGLAVQPRPIEEYVVGSGDALVYDGGWQEAHYEVGANPPFWSTDIYDLAPEGTARKHAIEPTNFIPLTSLPEPRR